MSPVRVPGRGVVEGWTLLAAAVMASPAGWQLSRGMLSLTDALIRYLIVLAGCCAVTLAVRGAWPLLAGPASPRGSRPVDELAAAAELIGVSDLMGPGDGGQSWDEERLWDAEGDVADLLGTPAAQAS
ncbi:hypothetical protein [Nocardioides sp. YIM 152588]|uniref:hypothetical protein n=1 Tax=Nocardioides sp. YIM 152588 TaxID=3158259 RepID=UPI0032E3DB05